MCLSCEWGSQQLETPLSEEPLLQSLRGHRLDINLVCVYDEHDD